MPDDNDESESAEAGGPVEVEEETAARSLLQGRLQEATEVAEVVRRVAAAPGMAFHGQQIGRAHV